MNSNRPLVGYHDEEEEEKALGHDKRPTDENVSYAGETSKTGHSKDVASDKPSLPSRALVASGSTQKSTRSDRLTTSVPLTSLRDQPWHRGQTEPDEADRDAPPRRYLMPPPVAGMVNWGIPTSTESANDPGLEAKFKRFADLKEQGKHFNESLMTNKAFKNPHLYAKLVEFVNVEESTTNYPSHIWDPFQVRKEWFSDTIADTQKQKYEQTQASQVSGKRTKIDFVSGSEPKGKKSQKGRTKEIERYHPYV
ncbi:hypothetical protein FRC20_004572 [Serendipita sp. 405]|nr:hypothetical protein FRC15_004023 [Serendipita sp. 397]KAG8867906.1 hypothetical protein FRC20_004572 [Serendipita sp. 405]